MTEIAIMIEGQDGLNWTSWQRIVRTVEDAGFAGLYRSDHYTNANPPDKDSLELWVSLTWLADNTERIEFAPLVSPVSFRDPTMTARMATAVDDLSGGRLSLGVGAGWQVREHTNFGWDLLDIPERFARFEEGLEVITRLLRNDEPSSFEGSYYTLKDAIMLPRPARPGGPPILIGGNGPRRTLPLVARFADEWNGVFIPPEIFAERSARLDALLDTQGRERSSVRRSLMTGLVFGRNEAELAHKAGLYGGSTVERLRSGGLMVGSAAEIVDHIGRYAAVGVQRLMLQWLDLDDADGLEQFAASVLPQLN
ncbi:MAG: TIGR03560 family F420-dependent LLM class oxidoreductase [Anaerolineae bacterium]|nr:TIGR03560 family F420-dependent LLM class oxidoreductase [Anaerolineae bacterium]